MQLHSCHPQSHEGHFGTNTETSQTDLSSEVLAHMDKDLKPVQTLTPSHILTYANTCMLKMRETNAIIYQVYLESVVPLVLANAEGQCTCFNSAVKESTCQPEEGSTAPHEAHSRARTEAQIKKHNAQTQKQAANTSNLGKKIDKQLKPRLKCPCC
jgi:hypothetical protein